MAPSSAQIRDILIFEEKKVGRWPYLVYCPGHTAFFHLSIRGDKKDIGVKAEYNYIFGSKKIVLTVQSDLSSV